MRTVIFDLDGTLADTSGDLLAAANAAFRVLGHDVQLDHDLVEDRGMALRGGRSMLRLGLSRIGEVREEDLDAGYPVLLEAYGAAICTNTRLYPGVMEAIERLAARGIPVGICTNKPQALAETLIRALGVRDAFASLVGADTLPVRKPDPAPFRLAVTRAGGDPARSVLLGDTQTDRDTARAAGVPSVLVRFGPMGPAAVEALGADALLDHYDDLDGILARLWQDQRP
jgi:phosphoglycolate phosphatase